MMVNRFFLFALITVIIGKAPLNAQDNCTEPVRIQHLTGELFQSYFMQYKGTPFYGDDWFDGSVQLIGGEIYENVKLRYDIYKDALHYYNPKLRRVVLLDKESVSAFWFNQAFPESHKKVVNFITTDTTVASGFYFQLLNDSVSLYLKARKRIDAQISCYPADGKLGVFYEKQFYFYQVNQSLHKLSLSRRNVLKQFPEIASELKHFIHKNHLKPKIPAHLIQIFEEINRLTLEK